MRPKVAAQKLTDVASNAGLARQVVPVSRALACSRDRELRPPHMSLTHLTWKLIDKAGVVCLGRIVVLRFISRAARQSEQNWARLW